MNSHCHWSFRVLAAALLLIVSRPAFALNVFTRDELSLNVGVLLHPQLQLTANGAPNASLFNATASGSEAKWVLGNFFPRDAGDTAIAQTGLWARRDAFKDPNNPDPTRRPISELDLSVRSRRIVDLLKIRTIGDLAAKTEAELLACPNFGQTSLNEIKTKLDEFGMALRG